MNTKKLELNKRANKSYEIGYNQSLEAMELKMLDPETIYPLYIRDTKAGLYKIIKNKSGKIQMTR